MRGVKPVEVRRGGRVVSHTELQFTGSILPECVTAS
jgi:hypothetical protein